MEYTSCLYLTLNIDGFISKNGNMDVILWPGIPSTNSTEGSLSKCLIDTAHSTSNSKNVDALKFRLAHYDTFYNGQIH